MCLARACIQASKFCINDEEMMLKTMSNKMLNTLWLKIQYNNNDVDDDGRRSAGLLVRAVMSEKQEAYGKGKRQGAFEPQSGTRKAIKYIHKFQFTDGGLKLNGLQFARFGPGIGMTYSWDQRKSYADCQCYFFVLYQRIRK